MYTIRLNKDLRSALSRGQKNILVSYLMRRLYDSRIPTKFIGNAETKPITAIRTVAKVMSFTVPIICPVSITSSSPGASPMCNHNEYCFHHHMNTSWGIHVLLLSYLDYRRWLGTWSQRELHYLIVTVNPISLETMLIVHNRRSSPHSTGRQEGESGD